MSRSKKIILLAIVGTVVNSEQILAQSRRGDTVNGGVATPRVIVPLRIYRNFLVLAEGQIGARPVQRNFVLDTGTAPSIINCRVATELGLPTAGSTMEAIGTIVPTRMTVLPDLKLGPIRVSALRVQVQDLSRLERDVGVPVAGILGLDVLSASSFRVDYEKRQLEFGEFAKEGIPVPFDVRAGIAVALVRLDGRSTRLVVDTGSDRIVILGGSTAQNERLGLRNASQVGVSLADKAMHVQVFHASDVMVGGQHFAVANAYFVSGVADPAFDGLLGIRALGFRAVGYDLRSKQLYLQK